MPFNTIELSVSLPAYNEGKKIKENVNQLKSKLDALKIGYEIIIINDGSSDDTWLKAKECESERIKVISYQHNRGKGYAIRCGMLQATGKHRLFMDVDLSTSLDAIGEFLNTMKNQKLDILVGSRKKNGSKLLVRQPFYRIFMGKMFTALAYFFVGYPLSDYTCGFKMYTRKAADIIFNKQRIFNWAFDAELIFIAVLHNLKIGELPVIWKNDPETKVHLLRDALTSFYGLLKIRANHLRKFYK